MKLDILVIASHPDDAELGAGGTILSHTHQGHKVGILDLTEGELGTRGTPEIRKQEAKNAAELLGVSVRENVAFRDGFFANDESHQRALIQKIRQYKPELIITNAPSDRHPDHGRAAQLVKESAFYAGLRRIETQREGQSQEAWRPHMVYHFIQFYYHKPDLVVDIEPFIEQKMKALLAYESQFYNPDSNEPETILTSPQFFETLKGRWREMGANAHLNLAEGFVSDRTISVDHLFQLKYEGKA